ncbi:dissimilatory-type sulfite reductase subunit beta [Vulcanisaeta thermophila]|uniref:dissimilatory-type sulfite reductase subunit beta n=1 Tax=Vulcanisaeta thermophila TaxID=867917 RepID=UPI000B30E30F|nr:dissimilatory-type sulfite reductase subunit beta [Vulcanisaeta thermophila]
MGMSITITPNPAERMNKVLPNFAAQLPDTIKRNYGRWVDRRFHGSGIIEHISETGDRIFTVKVGLPPNGRLSTETLRKIIEIADNYGLRVVRPTRSMNLEFVTDSLDKALKIKEEVEKLGFPVGGWGASLWSIVSCTAYLTCTTAVVDAPSITQVLYNHLKPYFTGEEKLPAKLRIGVSGCPNQCAGGLATDIHIVGHYGQAPRPDPERIKFCIPAKAEALKAGLPRIAKVCPVGAIKVFGKPDGTVGIEIDEKKCIACGRCKNVCDYLDWDPNKIGVAIFVGGKTSNTGSGPRLGYKVIPWLPVNPPEYKEIVAAVKEIIEVWRQNAKPGERLGDFIDRIGLENFIKMLGVPVTRHNRPSPQQWNFGIRQFNLV